MGSDRVVNMNQISAFFFWEKTGRLIIHKSNTGRPVLINRVIICR